MRLLAIISGIDKRHGHERALAMHLAQHRREGVAVLNIGGRDLAFDRQAERIDADVALASLDFLGGVKTARTASFRRRRKAG